MIVLRIKLWQTDTPRLLILVALFLLRPNLCAADAAGEKKRALLEHVQRVAVIPPFFATDTIDRFLNPEKLAPKPKAEPRPGGPNAPPTVTQTQYVGYLQRLEEHARSWFPTRIEVRTPFQVVPQEELLAAMKDLELTPAGLFQNNGRIRGGHYPLPNPQPVQKLAVRLHADAVVLCSMDEPRRTNGKYSVDFTGLNYENAHVQSKAGFYVTQPDGTEILHDYVETPHPVSHGSRDYLFADLKENEEQVIEDFLDELTRYTPVRKTKSP